MLFKLFFFIVHRFFFINLSFRKTNKYKNNNVFLACSLKKIKIYNFNLLDNTNKIIPLINQKVYCFSFFDFQDCTNMFSRYFVSFLLFKNINDMKKSDFQTINNTSFSYNSFGLNSLNILFVNYKKNYLSKIKVSRKIVLNFFFFLKGVNKLTRFIQKYKNSCFYGILTINRISLYSVCLLFKICYSYEDFRKKILTSLIYVNGLLIDKFFYILNKNDYVSFFINKWHLDYFIKLNYFLNSYISYSVKKPLKDYKTKNYTDYVSNLNLSFIKNIECFKPSMTLVCVYLKKKSINTNTYSFTNIINFRLYNWLITT